MKRWFLMVVVAVATGWVASPGYAQEDPRRTPIVLALERALPAVVTVKVEVQTSSPFMRFRPEARASEGSGVIIDAGGIVLTNAHVVDGARAIEVHLRDGRSFGADIVAQDVGVDLAVLRIRGEAALPTIPLGDSDDLLLGEPAIAIGNPFGLGHTVSTGVVASTGRDVSMGDGPKQTYIQTDAAINPGNSGGALVNIYGQLIGINTFIHSAAEGIGFAIPVNRARKVAEDLLRFGEVQLPWLGVALLDVNPRRVRGLPEGAVLVGHVEPDGPAAAAGLATGDLIVEVDNHRVSTRADLNARLAERRPGDGIALALVRDGAPVQLRVGSQSLPPRLGQRSLARSLGIQVSEVRGGLQVTEAVPQGTWAAAGLRAGDVIVGVDGRRVRSMAELATLVAQAKGRHRASVWFVVVRGPHQGSVEVEI